MAERIGGDLNEVTLTNNGNTFRFFTINGTDATVMPGGFSVEDDGRIDTSGAVIRKIKRMPWSVECELVSNEIDFTIRQLYDLMDPNDSAESEFTFTFNSGTILVGMGRPVGEPGANYQTSSIGIKFTGGGELEQIS